MASTVSNTTLRFATLSIPVALRKIQEKKDVTLVSATAGGNAVTQTKTDAVTAEVVETAQLQKGAYDDAGVFHPIDQEALDAAIEATKLDDYEISSFIPMKDVPFERATASYFLAPQKGKNGKASATAMALLHRGLVKTKKAGVMKLCLRTRQQLAVVYPKGKGLYVTLLVWSEDWTQADEANVLEGIAVEQRMVDIAVSLIDTLTAPDAKAAIDAQVDDLRIEREKLVAAALAGKPITARKPKAPKAEPDGLLAQLEASLELASAAR